MPDDHIKHKLRVILSACTAIVLILSFSACADSSSDTEPTEPTTVLVPTQGVEPEYDENGELTPDSKYQLWLQQRDEESREAYEKEQVEEIEKWYMWQPEHDPDEILPGGH